MEPQNIKFKLTAKQKKAIIGGIMAIILAIFGITSATSTTVAKKPRTAKSEKALSVSVDPARLYQVERVVDGDTIAVDVDGQEVTVRFIGMNTPETVDPRRPVQCFGKQASAEMKRILTSTTTSELVSVRLETDPTQGTTDRYGRLLAYVILEDGTLLNQLMIAEGYAYEYTYNIPYKYQKEFKKAEVDARTMKKGLWDTSICPVK